MIFSAQTPYTSLAVAAVMAAAGGIFLIDTTPDEGSAPVERTSQRGGGGISSSHSHHAKSLRELHKEADIAIEGIVVDIRYAVCEPTGQEGDRIPYTFVTYRVDESFKGMHPGKTVTLRFIGGEFPDSEKYLMTSIVPQFDVGDRDVLFVSGNTTQMSPLVRGRSGRLRIIDGEVYTDTGHSVRIEGDDDFRLGAAYDLPSVRTTRIHGKLTDTHVDSEARQRPSDAISAEELRGVMRNIALEPTAPREFVNANPNKPFFGPDITPSGPPKEQDASPAMPEDELAERARVALDANQKESRADRMHAMDQSIDSRGDSSDSQLTDRR